MTQLVRPSHGPVGAQSGVTPLRARADHVSDVTSVRIAPSCDRANIQVCVREKQNRMRSHQSDGRMVLHYPGAYFQKSLLKIPAPVRLRPGNKQYLYRTGNLSRSRLKAKSNMRCDYPKSLFFRLIRGNNKRSRFSRQCQLVGQLAACDRGISTHRGISPRWQAWACYWLPRRSSEPPQAGVPHLFRGGFVEVTFLKHYYINPQV